MPQIAFVVYPGVTALDIVGPYEVLRFLPDADIRFVWRTRGPVATDSGVLLLAATHTFDETPQPEIVVVPGGSTSVMAEAKDDHLLTWLRSTAPTTTWVTSVCFGSVLLAAAGLLESRAATSHWLALPILKSLGAEPVSDQRIVVDGKFATAAGVSAGIDLALWLSGVIAGDAHAKAVQLAIEYDPQLTYDEGHIAKAGAATKVRATFLLAKTSFTVQQVSASAHIAWQRAIHKARGRRGKRRPRISAPGKANG